MSEKTWKSVDSYFNNYLISPDPIMDNLLQANAEANLPAIDVSESQGKLLNLLVKMKSAKRVLEIGTLGGYSSIWMARALPEDGKLVTLEYSEKHARVAEKNMMNAGLKDKIEVITGRAVDTLPSLSSRGDSYDFIFIDADKKNNPVYVKWAIDLALPGACIIVDNVVREGEVLNENGDESVQGIREMVEMLSNEPRIDSTAIQTVGSKGYDGLLIAIIQ
ncbi:O-methyltransferase [Halobacillus sp. BBL2006]|uniref:O-methyltransferase n=1 Tax=Halobacillus sp. BBL2006 TaxID=1543706 RepID=UPI0005442EF8|nr:O-methyltransferase [Halobacillus sp. BBL2006]KHE71817.1 methyltransferase [Halobacillus sp. BBL2006]